MCPNICNTDMCGAKLPFVWICMKGTYSPFLPCWTFAKCIIISPIHQKACDHIQPFLPKWFKVAVLNSGTWIVKWTRSHWWPRSFPPPSHLQTAVAALCLISLSMSTFCVGSTSMEGVLPDDAGARGTLSESDPPDSVCIYVVYGNSPIL